MSRQTEAFVLRIWQESEEPAEQTLVRGSLQIVKTGEIVYFQTLDQLVDLLGRHAPVLPRSSAAQKPP